MMQKTLYYLGKKLDDAPDRRGELRRSDDIFDQPEALRTRMEEDGYLYLPGLLEPDRVRAARDAVLEALEKEGSLDPDYPREEAMARPGIDIFFRADLANGNVPVEDLLYTGRMMTFLTGFFGGPVRHFDYTWLRANVGGPKKATPPHSDIVFMGRGTPRLYTAWTPLMDIPYDLGGLMLLEGSHRKDEHLGEYWKMDVDTYCTNGPEAADIESGRKEWEDAKMSGAYDRDAVAVQERLTGRWLSAEYKAGDVLLFGMFFIHASADNRTPKIRLSTDSRYQLASEPADERWVGHPPPTQKDLKMKIGRIC